MRIIAVLVLSLFSGVLNAGETSHLKLAPVPFTAVEFGDGFWRPKLESNRIHTVPHLLEMFEKNGTIANFDKAAGKEKGEHRGNVFDDGLFYCAIQAAADGLAVHPDPEMDQRLDGIIARIAAAQEKDGYIHTFQQLKAPGVRWQYLKGTHDLYNAGQLIDAGAAHFQATGKRTLLDVAIRFADLLHATFGPGKKAMVSDHASPELALVRLYRLTGQVKYLDLARVLVDAHGRPEGRELLGEYAQDHKPFAEQAQVVGHAVRATLLYTGAADVAGVTGDPGYLAALERLWRNASQRRMYITGGLGAAPEWEGFGPDWDLPNEKGYLETCAGLGNGYWNQRMNLLTGEGRFADLFERVLYNAALVGVSLDGDRFFYENPLLTRGNHHRWGWHGCPCCPPNIAKFFSCLGGCLYATSDAGITVSHYAAGSARIVWKDLKVKVSQETRYPWDGRVKVTVEPEQTERFALDLRVPGWCAAFALKAAGEAVKSPVVRSGYVRIEREWKAGDTAELDLEMPIRRLYAHPNVASCQGRVALQRGPVLYCLEGMDNGGHVLNLALAPEALLEAEERPDLLGGVTVIRSVALARGAGEPDQRLYRPRPEPAFWKAVKLVAVPYFAWDNREPGEMTLWIPENPVLAEPILPVSASHSWQADTILGLLGEGDPAHSNDQVPRFSAWPHRGTTEWVQRDLDEVRKVSRVEVYWYDDSPENNAAVGGKVNGSCRAPKAWRILYRDGDAWKPVQAALTPGTVLNRYNAVDFAPVETKSLRLELDLQPEFTAGIIGWRIKN